MRTYVVMAAVGAAAFLAVNAAMAPARGGAFVGGEIFLLALPLWVWMARAMVGGGRR